MNLFQKYGIKEVADVTFYSIIEIGNEELYIPVLFLDTLKVSDLNQTSNKVNYSNGYGNSQSLSWQFGKKFSLSLQDALFTPASMNMTMGWIRNKSSKYINLIKKLAIVNKYYKNNYHYLAYPSPKLKEEEEELLFKVIAEHFNAEMNLSKYKINEPCVARNRHNILQLYYYRDKNFDKLYKQKKKNENEIEVISGKSIGENGKIFSKEIIDSVFWKINEVKDINEIESNYCSIQVLDRMEKCYVMKDEGMLINIKQQINNLYRYYNDDKSSNYSIFYDEKTMQPLALFDKEWTNRQQDDNSDIEIKTKDGEVIEDSLVLKKGTIYYKWSRTIQPVLCDNSFIGKSLIIDGNTFPDKYKIVGETYIREQNTSKDQRYQFVIPYAAIPSNQKIELKADGGPSIFSMEVEVLAKDNEPQIELRQFNVDKDNINGGTYVVPQSTQYTTTPIIIKKEVPSEIDNEIIY